MAAARMAELAKRLGFDLPDALARDLADFGNRELQLLGQLLAGGLAAQFLHKLPRSADQLVDRLDHVDRNANRSRLVGDGPRDRLPHPPGSVGREFVSTPVLELV